MHSVDKRQSPAPMTVSAEPRLGLGPLLPPLPPLPTLPPLLPLPLPPPLLPPLLPLPLPLPLLPLAPPLPRDDTRVARTTPEVIATTHSA